MGARSRARHLVASSGMSLEEIWLSVELTKQEVSRRFGDVHCYSWADRAAADLCGCSRLFRGGECRSGGCRSGMKSWRRRPLHKALP